jgi:enoyl-CoA hydratase/carnithine racemase
MPHSTIFELLDSAEGLTVTLLDGDQGNLLSVDQIAELDRVLTGAHEAEKRWVLIRHRGQDLCRGRAPGPKLDSARRGVLVDVVQRLQTMDPVVITALDGGCVGFGVGLFALADLSIATERAWFQFPEILGGSAPAIVATWLFDTVPYKMALDWILTGRKVSLEEAHFGGIVSRIVAPEALDHHLGQEIERLAAIPREALLNAKSIARVMKAAPRDLDMRRAIALKWFG